MLLRPREQKIHGQTISILTYLFEAVNQGILLRLPAVCFFCVNGVNPIRRLFHGLVELLGGVKERGRTDLQSQAGTVFILCAHRDRGIVLRKLVGGDPGSSFAVITGRDTNRFPVNPPCNHGDLLQLVRIPVKGHLEGVVHVIRPIVVEGFDGLRPGEVQHGGGLAGIVVQVVHGDGGEICGGGIVSDHHLVGTDGLDIIPAHLGLDEVVGVVIEGRGQRHLAGPGARRVGGGLRNLFPVVVEDDLAVGKRLSAYDDLIHRRLLRRRNLRRGYLQRDRAQGLKFVPAQAHVGGRAETPHGFCSHIAAEHGGVSTRRRHSNQSFPALRRFGISARGVVQGNASLQRHSVRQVDLHLLGRIPIRQVKPDGEQHKGAVGGPGCIDRQAPGVQIGEGVLRQGGDSKGFHIGQHAVLDRYADLRVICPGGQSQLPQQAQRRDIL